MAETSEASVKSVSLLGVLTNDPLGLQNIQFGFSFAYQNTVFSFSKFVNCIVCFFIHGSTADRPTMTMNHIALTILLTVDTLF